MVSVIWSDQSELIVYRSLQDFKTLHVRFTVRIWHKSLLEDMNNSLFMHISFQQRQLKKKFPVENQFRKEDRVLPRFGGRINSFLGD